MNISLTTVCNNHCPYCFQEDWREQEKKEMSLQDFFKVLEWADTYIKDGQKIGLLGGEPTIYPHFNEVIDIISERYPDIECVIFTNLLCKGDAVDKIKSSGCGLLINTCYDDDKEERFLKNLDRLVSENDILYKYTFGTTLFEDHDKNRVYIDRLITLLKRYPVAPVIRVGLSTPNSGLGIPKVENYDDDVLYLMEKLSDLNANCRCGRQYMMHFDCPVNFCALSTRAHNLILGNFQHCYQQESFHCIHPVIDILPDLSMTYCASSGNNWRIDNALKFESPYALNDYLREQNSKYEFKNETCLSCDLFHTVCYPCHCVDESLCGTNNCCEGCKHE